MIQTPKNPFFHPEEPEPLPENVPVAKTYPAHEEKGQSLAIKEGFTSIIVPVYLNSYPVFHYTGHCLGSIRQNTDQGKTPYEIIFVQNGRKGTENVIEEFTEETYKQIGADKIISNEKNLGFAAAVNQGIRCSTGEFIAIINNDAMVFPHWLEDMQEALTAGLALAMATPMYGMPFARATEAAIFRAASFPLSEGTRNVLKDSGIEKTFADFRDFSCVLTTRALFEKVGLFDEQFFMYGEDLDLIRRIEKEGGKVASTTRVRTFHISGGTSSGLAETPEILDESKRLLKEKWGE